MCYLSQGATIPEGTSVNTNEGSSNNDSPIRIDQRCANHVHIAVIDTGKRFVVVMEPYAIMMESDAVIAAILTDPRISFVEQQHGIYKGTLQVGKQVVAHYLAEEDYELLIADTVSDQTRRFTGDES
jgi:hypothetical protein